jgi:glutathione S-transferase
MIDLHYWPTSKSAENLHHEECGLPYRMVPVNIGKGEQFTPSFWPLAPTTECQRSWTTPHYWRHALALV